MGLFVIFLITVFALVVPLVFKIKMAEKQMKKLQAQQEVARRKHTDTINALKILCLPQNPTRRQVRDAHRRMMVQNHPDRGGSKADAAKINVARDVLLDEVA